MADRHADTVLHGLCRLVETQASQLSDGQLLSRFATDRDEFAFAVLLQRYGRLVYGVCRNVLRHDQDAEDAFQATFLVLARRASAIRTEKAIGSWLYRVAYRVSLKARNSAERRRQQESQAAKLNEQRPPSDLAWRELQAMLDEELNRLPAKYRSPFVLCVLLGKTKSEAAVELAWKEGTVSSRLSHARQLLRTRLARRGVLLSALLSGLAISDDGRAAAVPAALVAEVQQAVPRFLSGEAIATGPAVIARSVIQGMAVSRLAFASAVVATICLVGAGVAIALNRPGEPAVALAHQPSDEGVPAAAPKLPVVAPDPPRDGLQQMVIRGQVVGSDGKAVPGANIAILADEDRPAGDRDFSAFTRRRVITTGKADADGKFQFVTPRPIVRQREERICLVRGEGQTVSWQRLHSLTAVPPLEMKLEKGQKLRGRLVDADGAAVAGVTLRFGGFHRVPDPLSPLTDEIDAPAWPSPIVTDSDGRFELDGALRRATAYFRIDDERYGPHWLALVGKDSDETDVGTIRLPAPRVFEGTVFAEDTQRPLADAIVVVRSYDAGGSIAPSRVIARTDAKGRFTVKPYPGKSLSVYVAGAPGTPYLATQPSVEWPAGALRHRFDVRLQRGVLLRGRVVEHGSGLAVPGARIQYRPMSGKNRNGDKGNLLVLWKWLDAASDANGLFELPVLPGPGHLLVRGPNHEWIPLEVGDDELIDGKKGGDRLYYPDALVPVDLKADAEPAPVVATLRRGVTLKGRVVTADGKPVISGFLISRNYLGSGWEQNCEFLPVRDGRFEIPGCDPDKSEPYWFWDHKALQGAMVTLSVKDQDTTVRLAPFGSASLRFVDNKGSVLPNQTPRIYLVIRPGRSYRDPPDKNTPIRLTQDANFQGIHTDPATGVVTAKALVPGATYVVETNSGRGSKPFSVPSGQNVRLPDVVVEPPPKPKKP